MICLTLHESCNNAHRGKVYWREGGSLFRPSHMLKRRALHLLKQSCRIIQINPIDDTQIWHNYSSLPIRFKRATGSSRRNVQLSNLIEFCNYIRYSFHLIHSRSSSLVNWAHVLPISEDEIHSFVVSLINNDFRKEKIELLLKKLVVLYYWANTLKSGKWTNYHILKIKKADNEAQLSW